MVIKQEDNIKAERAGIELLNLTDDEKIVWDNYLRYNEWELEKHKSMAQKLENNPLTDIWRDELYYEIERTMAYMDTNANIERGRPLAHEVFKEELKLLNLDINYPFDSGKLHLINNITREKNISNSWDEETCEYVYNGLKQILKAKIQLAISGEKQLHSGIASPWTFYIHKIGLEGFSYQLLSILVLIFTGAIVLEGRRNRSNKLIEMLPEKRSYIIRYYYKVAFISVASVLIMTFILPIIFLGFRYGFEGLKNPTFVYKQSFTSFTGYKHVEDFWYYGLGKFYGIRPWFEGGYLPATVLTVYPLWKVMVLSLGISLLKMVFFTILGVGIGISFSNVVVSSFMLPITSLLYLVSQRFSNKLNFNPFAITSSWDIATGAASYTWFKSVVILLISIVVMHIIFYAINQKRDYVG
ncbi:MAG: hypothetical protein RIN63_07810 [Tissierella sp.]|nr:hypothetical protein [Tissierella sp.]